MKEQNARDKIVTGNLRKALIDLAVPMAIANAAQNLFNLTDLFFVGKLGPTAVAAVGMAGVVNMAVITFVIGTAIATRALVSREIGAQDYEAAHRAAVGSVFLGAAIWLILGSLGTIFSRIILYLMGAQGELLELATNYLMISMAGSGSVIFIFIVISILQGAGDAKTAMFITFFAVLLNVVLDPLFIFGIGFFPQWGVSGAAFATVLSDFAGVFLGFAILFKGVNAFKLHLHKFVTDKKTLHDLLRIGAPGGGQVLAANIIAFIMMRIATPFGIAATAAYTVGIRLNMMALLPGFALGNAVGTVVGQNLGAANVERAKQSVALGIRFHEYFAIPLALLYIIFAKQIVSFFTTDPEAIVFGANYLRIVSLAHPIFAIGTVLLRAINGAGHVKTAFWAQVGGLYIVQLPIALLASKHFGITGIWIAISMGMMAQGLILIPYFRSNKWATIGKWGEKVEIANSEV